MRSVFALSIAATATLGAAQLQEQYTIDPDSVPEATRDYWCDQNKAQCPLICLQQPGVNSMTTQENDCDADALTYTCICDDGSSPNITQYSQTLPYFICTQWGNNCVDQCNGDNTCQSDCRENHPCGAQSPFTGNATSSASGSASATQSGATATSQIPVTGFGGAATTSSSSSSSSNTSGAGAVFVPNASFGLAALFGSVFLGFAVLL